MLRHQVVTSRRLFFFRNIFVEIENNLSFRREKLSFSSDILRAGDQFSQRLFYLQSTPIILHTRPSRGAVVKYIFLTNVLLSCPIFNLCSGYRAENSWNLLRPDWRITRAHCTCAQGHTFVHDNVCTNLRQLRRRVHSFVKIAEAEERVLAPLYGDIRAPYRPQFIATMLHKLRAGFMHPCEEAEGTQNTRLWALIARLLQLYRTPHDRINSPNAKKKREKNWSLQWVDMMWRFEYIEQEFELVINLWFVLRSYLCISENFPL